MNLRDYLHKERITAKSFAETINYTPDHIRNYIRGSTKLGKKAAILIEKATNGKVTAKEIMKGNPKK